MSRARGARILLLFGVLISSSAYGGLHIGGWVGKQLDRGKGAINRVLGAPAEAEFNGAINKWGQTNEMLISKLGATNDRTVAQLLNGLDKISTDIKSDVDRLSASLQSSVSALDVALSSSVDKLSFNLNNQTGRLDTVFQKQTDTLFYLGRIFLSVLIMSGMLLSIFQIIKSVENAKNVRAIFIMRRPALIATAGVAVLAIALTWLMPNLSPLKDVSRNYQISLKSSLALEDFAQANYSASQLVLLEPAQQRYQAWEEKSRAFRDLFLRPTVLLRDENVQSLYDLLNQAEGHAEAPTNVGDPDIAAMFDLVETARSNSESDFVRSEVLAFRAMSAYKDQSADANAVAIPQIQAAVSRVFASGRSMLLPPEYVGQLEVTTAGQRATDFDKEYESIASSAEDIFGKSHTSDDASYPVGAVEQFSDVVQRRLLVRQYYRGLTAKYFDLLMTRAVAAAPGSPTNVAGKPAEKFCELNHYFAEWYADVGRDYSSNPAFVSLIYGGPFMILDRARKLYPSATCDTVTAADISQHADQISFWAKTLSQQSQATTPNGISFLSASATQSAAAQTIVFADFELASLKLKDKDAPAIKAELPSLVRDVASRAAALGLFAPSTQDAKHYVPAIYWLKLQLGAALTEQDWRLRYDVFMQSRVGG